MESPRCSLSSHASPPPTVYVQADPETFRDLVQKHTGFAMAPPSARPTVGPHRRAFKLQDRRPSVRKLEIKLGLASLHQQQQQHHHPSPVTPLGAGALFSPPGVAEAERAIAGKGFYLHPSPRGAAPPELLPLFPLTSPKMSSPASSGDDGDGRSKRDQL